MKEVPRQVHSIFFSLEYQDLCPVPTPTPFPPRRRYIGERGLLQPIFSPKKNSHGDSPPHVLLLVVSRSFFPQ